jgi:chromosome segregation ATPase
MELLDKLEKRIDCLLQSLQALEDENRSLKGALEKEQQNKDNVLKRIDNLLQKLQDVNRLY